MSTLAAEVGTLAAGLGGLKSRLLQVQEYLAAVASTRLPVNHDILYQLQARAARHACMHARKPLSTPEPYISKERKKKRNSITPSHKQAGSWAIIQILGG